MARRTSFVVNVFLLYAALLLAKLVQLPFLSVNKTEEESPDSVLNFTERSHKHGYNADEHTVFTKDGYILTLFHMEPRECSRKSMPVLLMHGLLMSSDTWLDTGPGESLAYLLSDACFDIWVGNTRGNQYGRRHATLDPDTEHEFWDFSADEVGFYDIPAIVDYVLQQTGSDKLDYIGFSQGAGTLLMMCSERPGYCDKLRMYIALAPATRLVHSKSKALKILTNKANLLENFMAWFRLKEMQPKGGVVQTSLSFLCQYDLLLEIVCRGSLTLLDAYNEGSIKPETLKFVHANFPTGTSIRTLARYGQAFWSDSYQKFDHGEHQNLKLYGQSKPPQYNISAVSVPTVLIYGRNDHLVDPKDIEWLSKSLPNLLEKVEVADTMWNHFDFMYSQHVKTMVFPTLLKYLSRDDGTYILHDILDSD